MTNLFRRLYRRSGLMGAYRKWELARNYGASLIGCPEYRELFDGVETFCLFLGYPRSGHTLIASLLDAHPEMVVAVELHALRYIRRGFSREQLFYLLLRRSRVHARRGMRWTNYSYAVPHQWQGRFQRLRVIGDKKAPETVTMLSCYPGLLERLRTTVGVDVKFIHTVRNPYDNMSSMYLLNRGRGLRANIEAYFSLLEGMNDLQKEIGEEDLIQIRLETFIEDPVGSLTGLCRFLRVDAAEGYLDDCASIVLAAPRATRCEVPWEPGLLQAIGDRVGAYRFLDGYSFDD